MNAILHGANTCTPKKQASQLIVELGKSISNGFVAQIYL